MLRFGLPGLFNTRERSRQQAVEVRMQKRISNIPSTLTSHITRLGSFTTFSKDTQFCPAAGWAIIPYAIDYIKSSVCYEWEDELGIHVDGLSTWSITKADLSTFNNPVVQFQQTNIAFGVTVTDTESWFSTYGSGSLSDLVDGDATTYCEFVDVEEDAELELFRVDLGSVQTAAKICFLMSFAASAAYGVRVKNEISEDGSAWTSLKNTLYNGTGAGGATIYESNTNKTFRYFRVLVDAASTYSVTYAIYEFVAWKA